MIDSGCNTLLVPLKEGELQILIEEFPSNHYQWSVSESHGVSALNSLSFSIETISGITPVNGITVKIAEDLYGWTKLVNRLRFHLAYQDVILLNQMADQVRLSQQNRDILREYLETIEKIIQVIPEVKIGERRKHALFGQSFLDEVCSIQAGQVLLAISNFEQTQASISGIILELIRQRPDLTSHDRFPEFNDLMDEDHDGGDESLYIIDSADYLDE